MKISPIFTLPCLIIPAQLLAAGYYLPNQDAFATARGNAFVATADNPSAVFYNPAGLTQIKRSELEVGVYAITLGNQATVGGVDYDADKQWQEAPHLFYAMPINDRMTFGFGLNSPYGLGTEWGQNTPFRTVVTEGRLMYISATAAFAWKIDETLSLGLSVSGNYSKLILAQGLGFFPTDFLSFEGDGYSISGGLGLRWQPTEKHAFGLTINSASSTDLEGTLSSNVIKSGPAKLDFSTPLRAAIGYSYRPAPGWNLEADIEWLDWDSLDSLTLRGKTLPGYARPVKFNWKSSFIYEIGASYLTEGGWRFAAGYDYNSNAQPDANFTPAVADADRQWVNAGVGHDYKDWSWFLAYQFGFANRTVSGSPLNAAGKTANGKYESRDTALVLSLKHNF
jgi:long-chain fatty acid transport protein